MRVRVLVLVLVLVSMSLSVTCIADRMISRATAHHCNVCTLPIDAATKDDVIESVKKCARGKRSRDEELLKLIESEMVFPDLEGPAEVVPEGQ